MRAVLLGLVMTAGCAAQAAPDPAPGTFERIIRVKAAERRYRLVVPNGLRAAEPVPLVFAFHGLGDSEDFMPRYSRLDALAADKKCLVVYGVGEQRRWKLALGGNGDLDYFDAVLEEVSKSYPVDARRVYAVGMSNGGFFCHVLASQRSDRVAAIAAHSAGVGFLEISGIRPKRKYPVLLVHGEKDRVVPVDRGRRARDLYAKAGHVVEYVEIPDMGHRWAPDIHLTMWEFFSKHPMK